MDNQDSKNASARIVYLRILTTTTDPERVIRVRKMLKKQFEDMNLTFHHFEPYWKTEGWGELNATLSTSKPLNSIQNRLADHWKSDTASDGIRLPDVGFLWVGE